MRVVAGRARGIRLAAPRGTATRPITDRVKETLFAILAERLPDARVLDLYAGSGAMGIEALSRGAAMAVFVERDREAAEVIRDNLARSRMSELGRVIVMDVERFVAADPSGRFDVALVDPPYAERAILAPLQRLVPWLAADAVVVVKHFWRAPPPEVDGLAVTRTRRFGETSVSFLTATRGEEQR